MSGFVAISPRLTGLTASVAASYPLRQLVASGLVVICLTCLLTVSDAFETQGLGLFHQLTLWAIVSALLIAQLNLSQQIVGRILQGTLTKDVIAVTAAIAITVVLMTFELHLMKFTPLLPKKPDPLPQFFVFVAQPAVAVAGLVLLIQYLSIPVQPPKRAPAQSNFRSPLSKDLEKRTDLTDILKHRSVSHIQAHDHYLELHCEEGKFFIRARMKDALEQLDKSKGVQVHRSHWVSHHHIQRMFRDGRDYKLLLKNNAVIPVARSRVAAIKTQS